MGDRDSEEIEVRLLLEAIFAQYGYDFRDYCADSMRRRVQAALAKSGLAHLGDLQHRLLVDPRFFASLLDDLTVQVSEMFRDPPTYRTFRERVVPILRTYPQVKIWHAGCASGEEVYTTAILLTEENLYDRTQIYATDVSHHALYLAREGVYRAAEAEAFERSYLQAGGTGRFQDYCAVAYGGIAMKESLRRNVVFFQHDLVSDYALGEMHVVFCRNVLIYFGDKLREHVVSVFADSLCRGGFLCLGNSERLPASRADAFLDFAATDRIYRRRGQA
ncbi:MAG TPA: protein-glutamate O-methyltransferase CheR [Polyangiaceae bacterium]|nr:protein-glutamate O-methyltransferase CheR [Polyangiaceae bacterium]